MSVDSVAFDWQVVAFGRIPMVKEAIKKIAVK
jgi:hypothetical protein